MKLETVQWTREAIGSIRGPLREHLHRVKIHPAMSKKHTKNTLNVGAGLAIGVMIGLLVDSLAMGIGIGLAIGIALSLEDR